MPFNHDPKKSLTPATSVPAAAPLVADSAALDPTLDPTLDPGAETGVDYSPVKLSQDAKAKERLIKQDPGSLAQVEQLARSHALRTLNGLRVIAPVLRQAFESASTPEKQAANFTISMNRARAFALQGCQYLDLDSTLDKNRWAVAMFERAFIVAFAEGDVPENVAEALFKSALAQADPRGQDSIVPDRKEDSTVVRQALIAGLSQVVCEQARFGFFRPDAGADIQLLGQLLVDSAEQVLDAHVLPMTADLERQSMLAALIEEGGRLMAQAWRLEAVKAQASMKSRTKDQMQRWATVNPHGLPLDHVMLSFRQQMAVLSKLMKVPRPRR
jgi:hypothetical protein